MTLDDTAELDEVRNRVIRGDSIELIAFDVLEFPFDLLSFKQEVIKKTRQVIRRPFFISILYLTLLR
jgi:hypothetical protein